MTVLIDARTLGANPSGVGMYTYNYIQGIRRTSDWRVVLITDVIESVQMRQLQEEGVEIHAYGKPAAKTWKVFAYFRFVQQVIHQVQPEIFWETNNLFSVRLVNPHGKIVVTVHDLFPFTLPECYAKWYPMYFHYGMNRVISDADGILFISKETQKTMEKYFPLATKKTNAINYNIIREPMDHPKKDGDYFLYIGNLERRKGTDILLLGYQKYVEAGGTRPLRLGGKVREQDIQNLLEETKRRCPKLEYMGYVTAEERLAYYSGCFGLVFPSRAEGFGMPVIEALCHGKPVLVSDLPIFHETAEDVLQFFPFGKDEMESADHLAHAMMTMKPVDVTLAREKANEYREENLVPNLLRFFEELCK